MVMRVKKTGLAAVGAMAISAFAAGESRGAIIDLGFMLDGSFSVSSTQYNQASTALSQALGQIPTSGANQYRLAVTSYGSSSGVDIVAPTIVTAANQATIQTQVASAAKAGGTTNTSGAITYMFDLFNDDGGLGDTTLFNITTDGSPNSQSATGDAAFTAWQSGVDGISFEAVGSGVSSSSAQNNMAQVAGLGTSGDSTAGMVLSPGDAIPNATTTGFVIPVADFDAYADAINAKVEQVVIDTGGGDGSPNVIPLPAGMPLMLAGIGAFAFMRRRQIRAA